MSEDIVYRSAVAAAVGKWGRGSRFRFFLSRSEENPFCVIESSDEERSEMNAPEMLVDLLEAELSAAQGLGDEQCVALLFDRAVGGDGAYLKARWIVDGREGRGKGTAQPNEVSGRTVQANGFVGALVVEHRAKSIETLLLVAEAVGSVEQWALEQGAVHPLMTAVVLRVSRDNEDGLNVELHQPYAEARQPAQPMPAKGRAVVAKHGVGQTVLAKDPLDYRPDQTEMDRRQGLTGQYVTTHRLSHGQGITPVAVAQSELAFEVDGDQFSRHGRLVSPLKRRVNPPARAARPDQSVAFENRIDGRPSWPTLPRVGVDQTSTDFLRSKAKRPPP